MTELEQIKDRLDTIGSVVQHIDIWSAYNHDVGALYVKLVQGKKLVEKHEPNAICGKLDELIEWAASIPAGIEQKDEK